MSLLEVVDLRVTFAGRRGPIRAVDGVSFALEEGETLGIVGESGSGKSVTSLAIFDLIPCPPAIVEARQLNFAGRDLRGASPRERRAIAGRDMALVFQDPLSALNPFLSIGAQLAEVLETHRNATRKQALARAAEALAEVGIPSPSERLRCYPHELSGGMRQRVLIAMAILCQPKLLIADEPTTALDVTVQAQVLDLLRELQRRHGTAIALITHSLGVVAGSCDRVNVMYAGRIVESAPTEALFRAPLHPYTRGLLASVPRLDRDPSAKLASIPGTPPDPAENSVGCSFAPRCALAFERCRREEPALESAIPLRGESRRAAACFLAREGAA